MKQRISLVLFLLVSSFSLLAQQRALRGVVIDQGDRSPIPFANVVIQGTTHGTQTNLEGEFVIDQLPPGPYVLKVSFVGYKTEITPEYRLTTKDIHLTVE